MDDATLTLIMLLTIFGFVTLAFLLLAPIYRFLKREQKAGEQLTKQIQRRRLQEPPSSPNGSSRHDQTTDENPAA